MEHPSEGLEFSDTLRLVHSAQNGEGASELLGSTPVGAADEAALDLSLLPAFLIGSHALTLEVTDGEFVITSDMTLTVGNSPPEVGCSGAGTYQLGVDTVQLDATVSDFDGDLVFFVWSENALVLASGSQATAAGGAPVALPTTALPTGTGPGELGPGTHTLTVSVDDGTNAAVTCEAVVEVVDTEAPTLAPVSDVSILWPPNHKLVSVTIQANASDSSGGPVTLSATVTSSEDALKDGSGQTQPDFTDPVIDQQTGTITLQLRAERSGKGPGRVYSIAITATDGAGNQSTSVVEVIAPHDKG